MRSISGSTAALPKLYHFSGRTCWYLGGCKSQRWKPSYPHQYFRQDTAPVTTPTVIRTGCAPNADPSEGVEAQRPQGKAEGGEGTLIVTLAVGADGRLLETRV